MKGEAARKMIRNIVIEMFIAKTVQFIGDTVSESQRRKQSRRRGARGGYYQTSTRSTRRRDVVCVLITY